MALLKPIIQPCTDVLIFFITITTIWPLVSVFFLLNEIFRTTLKIWYFIFDSKYTLASGGQSYFLNRKQLPDRMIVVSFLTKEEFDITQEKKQFENFFLNKVRPDGTLSYSLLMKAIRPKIFNGWYGFWRDDVKIDLSSHVNLWQGSQPRNGKYFTEEEFFTEIISPLSHDNGVNTDPNKPQWEWIVVPRVQINGEVQTARVVRIHHSYMDGVSLQMLIMDFLFQNKAENEKPFVINYTNPPPELRSPLPQFLINVLAFFFIPLFIFGGYILNRKEKNGSRNDPFLVKDREYVGKRHYAVSEQFDASILKRIKDKYSNTGGNKEVSTNQILVAALQHAGAVMFNGENQESQVCLVFAKIPRKKDKLENACFASTFTLPLQKNGDDSSKLFRICKNHLLNLVAATLMEWIYKLPLPLVERIKSNISVIFSSLPISREKGHLWGGHQVTDLFGWGCPTEPVGVLLSCIRYGDSLRFCGVAEHSSMSYEILQSLLQEMSEFLVDLGTRDEIKIVIQ